MTTVTNRWTDSEGNSDWDGYAQEAIDRMDAEQGHLPLTRSWDLETIQNCGTCEGGGCGDCVE